MFAPDNTSQASLIFGGTSRSLPIDRTSPKKIINFCDEEKSFITLPHVANVIKLFTP